MKGCILDQRSFDRDDISLDTLLSQLDHWDHYPSSLNQEVGEKIQDCDVVITNKVKLDRAVIESAKNLKLVMLAATGTDNVDLIACQERGITVCNARQYSNPAVVQHVFTLMLCLMTNVVRYHTDVQQGAWSQSDVFCLLDHPIREMENKTLGIIGYGNLGQAVANVGRAFGMEILIGQRPNSAATDGRTPLDTLYRQADIISLHCPLTQDTQHLLGKEQFASMKPEAIVINTARGAIINPQDLANALRAGEIAGAGIDVLDQEPPAPDYVLLDQSIPNLIVTPHNAWGTLESRQRLVKQMAANLDGWRNGSPQNVVV